jgi:Glycosyl hydrolase family 26
VSPSGPMRTAVRWCAGPVPLVAGGLLLMSVVAGCSSPAPAAPPASRATVGHAAPSTRTPSAGPKSATAEQHPNTTSRPPVMKRVGVSLPLQRLDSFIAATGSVPAQLSIYQHWASNDLFDQVAGFAAQRKGMGITVAWEPRAPECDCADQPLWSDRKIADGAHDAYVKAYAQSLKAYAHAGGGIVTIRLGHEMNGNWYPWAVGVNGNTAGDYIAMWRHVHDAFVREGVKNVRWMWSPNVQYDGATEMAATYPGDAYVDDVGLSGYNLGPGEFSSWRTFADLFQPSLDELRSIAPNKPLYLAEIGSVSNGGDKAAWIADMFTQLKQRPYIAGFVWFDQSSAQQDWLIEDSGANIAAWKAGVAALQKS